jgi:hypothetical protein
LSAARRQRNLHSRIVCFAPASYILAIFSRYATRRLGDPDRGIDPAVVRMRIRNDKTDYQHRHFVNLAAAAFLLLITIAVIWTVRAIDKQETLNRCFMSGRQNCIEIAPANPRAGVYVPPREQNRH